MYIHSYMYSKLSQLSKCLSSSRINSFGFLKATMASYPAKWDHLYTRQFRHKGAILTVRLAVFVRRSLARQMQGSHVIEFLISKMHALITLQLIMSCTIIRSISVSNVRIYVQYCSSEMSHLYLPKKLCAK